MNRISKNIHLYSGLALWLFVSFFYGFRATAQTGGKGIYRFLELPWYPRAAALGGTVVSMPDTNVNFVLSNPGMLTEEMTGQLALNYSKYFDGIGFGSAVFAFRLPVQGSFASGITFIRYGDFTAADETGVITGTFRAAEYSLPLSYARKIDSSFNVGITLRPVFSVFEQYRSFGLLADAGITWHSRKGFTTAGLLVRNMGAQISSYVQGTHEAVPLEILAGFTHKLQYAPFRFVITARQLQNPVMLYEQNGNEISEYNPGINTFETVPQGFGRFSENVMRHLITGVEFLPGNNLAISIAYNYQRRQELKIRSRPGMVGFSWGFRLHVSSFNVSYGRAVYHLAGATNHFSVSTNLNRFFNSSLLK